ncbi:hypothetical protein ABW19_dt0205507 [Dactylella cylindrospora]|nr:hypothetical protein ABW19_dt0205507 [Dactylella cylindrospora]
MRNLKRLWHRRERTSLEWERLWKLLKDFTSLQTFWRWSIQYRQFTENITFAEASNEWYFWGPFHLASHLNLEIYQDYLEAHGRVYLDNFWQPLGGGSRLHYEDTFFSSSLVDELLEDNEDISKKRLSDDLTPFMICLSLAAREAKANKNSSALPILIQSLEHLVHAGANLNELYVEEPQLPLHRIIAIGDTHLFDLVTVKTQRCRNPINLKLRDKSERTILHTVFLNSGPHELPEDYRLIFGRKLLDLGLDPNDEDANSRMPLFGAVRQHDLEGVNLILNYPYTDSRKLNIDDYDDQGDTALTYITTINKDPQVKEGLGIIESLVHHGARLDLAEKVAGLIPWMLAVWFENYDYANKILDLHIKDSRDSLEHFTAQDLQGQNALHRAAYDSSWKGTLDLITERPELTVEVKKEMVEAKAMSGGEKLTVLQLALSRDQLDLAYYLCSKWNADDKLKLPSGKTIGEDFLQRLVALLHLGVARISELAKYFFSRCERLELCWALILIKGATAIDLLAQIGLDLYARDNGGWDAFDWAYATGRSELLREASQTIIDYEARRLESKKPGHLPTAWNTEHANEYAEFPDESKLEVRFDAKYQDRCVNDVRFCVTANLPISPYVPIFYYEVTIIDSSWKEKTGLAFGVGLTSAPQPIDRLPGWPPVSGDDPRGYGFHGDDGHIFSHECEKLYGQHWTLLPTGETLYGVGSTVGCGYNQEKHTIFWTLDGKYLGVGFRDVRDQLYPIIGCRFGFTAKANFGTEPFLWDGVELEVVDGGKAEGEVEAETKAEGEAEAEAKVEGEAE